MERVYNYFCLNDNCTGNRSQKVKMDEEDKEDVFCIHCESKMKRLGQECNVIGRFSCMSLNERKVFLKKRSNEHYKKHIKGEKEYLDRAALGLEK